MSIQLLSPNSVAANPTHVNPQVKAAQTASIPQADQNVQKAVQALKTDTVTISREALQMLSKDGDTTARETRESVAEKASEKARGKS